MTNSPAYDIAQKLDTESIGTFAGTSAFSIYCFKEPDSPDDVITIYDTGGTPEDGIAKACLCDNFSIQIRIRGNDYSTMYTKMKAIETAIHNVSWVDSSVTQYFVARSDVVTSLPRDTKDRLIMVQNYTGLRSAV